jgi:TorA maturation chaperone TorD
MSDATIMVRRPLPPEDEARAEFYALLARLFSDAPDASLLAAIAGAPSLAPPAAAGEGSGPGDGGTSLASAWDALRAASAAMDSEAARDEFQALFVGIGRSEVSLYASHYLGPQSGRPLAEIRATLAGLGLGRRPESSEFEDHLSAVLETMRMLVAGDEERRPVPIAEQQSFFDRHVGPWAFDCCSAIATNSVANYYRRVAQFADYFLALERDSFAVED